MADRKDAGRICDDTSAGGNGPPAGGKRRLIREGGSASRVSIHARPRDPGGGTVLTVPPRRTILDDVSLAAKQSGGDTTLHSQLMQGITHLEHLALRVSLDCGPMA